MASRITAQQRYCIQREDLNPRWRSLEQFLLVDILCTNKVLGTGAYGEVVELEMNGLPCAGKQIHEELLSGAREMLQDAQDIHLVKKFFDECTLMSSLRNPHIVQFLGITFFQESPEVPLLVMERLYTSLDDLLVSAGATEGGIPLPWKISILMDVLRGLAYLHNHSPVVIHRDLTAKNVLLTPDMMAKITDFGVSRIVDLRRQASINSSTSNIGTLVYMPPEACEGVVTRKLDVFSFGVLMLYVMGSDFPGNLLAPSFVDDKGQLVARTELQRRQVYFDKASRAVEGDPLSLGLIAGCLTNNHNERPTVELLLSKFVLLQESHPRKLGSVNRLVLEQWALGNEFGVTSSKITELEKQREALVDRYEQQLSQASKELDELRGEVLRAQQLEIEHYATLQDKRRECEQLQKTLLMMDGELLESKEREAALIRETQVAKMDVEEHKLTIQKLEHRLQQPIIKDSSIFELYRRQVETLNSELQRMTKALSGKIQPSGLKVSLNIHWTKPYDCPYHTGSMQCVLFGSRICLSSGTISLNGSTPLVVYDPSSQRCGKMSYPLSHFAMVVLSGHQLLLVGGYNHANDTYSAQIAVWDKASKGWNTTIYPPMPTERGDVAATADHQWLLAAGGYNLTGRLATVEVLDTVGQQWYTVSSLPSPCTGLQHAVSGNTWYLLGGDGVLANHKRAFSVSMTQLVLQAANCSTTESVWKVLPEMPLGNPGVAIVRGYLTAIGGKDIRGQPSKEIHLFLPGTWEWLQVSNLPSPRHSCTCAFMASTSTLVVIAGGHEGAQTLNRIDQGSLTFSQDIN